MWQKLINSTKKIVLKCLLVKILKSPLEMSAVTLGLVEVTFFVKVKYLEQYNCFAAK